MNTNRKIVTPIISIASSVVGVSITSSLPVVRVSLSVVRVSLPVVRVALSPVLVISPIPSIVVHVRVVIGRVRLVFVIVVIVLTKYAARTAHEEPQTSRGRHHTQNKSLFMLWGQRPSNYSRHPTQQSFSFTNLPSSPIALTPVTLSDFKFKTLSVHPLVTQVTDNFDFILGLPQVRVQTKQKICATHAWILACFFTYIHFFLIVVASIISNIRLYPLSIRLLLSRS